MWPADRAAFAAYWNKALAEVHIDATVRAYLHDLIELRFLAWPFRPAGARLHRSITTGFLPQRFRAEMGLSWSAGQQRRFDRLLIVIGAVASARANAPISLQRDVMGHAPACAYRHPARLSTQTIHHGVIALSRARTLARPGRTAPGT